MTEYMTEQEQIQQLKNWLKQYGTTILAGIAIALVITTGWHYWQSYQEKKLAHASGVNEEMLALRAQGNMEGATVQAQKLLKNYKRTPYAQMAAFMLARDAISKQDYSEAIKQLNWVVDNGRDSSIREIARLRIARILITQKKPQEAVEMLSHVEDKNFMGLINEVKGDAYLSMNDKTAARNAYAEALKQLPNAEATRPLLQMKFDNLAV